MGGNKAQAVSETFTEWEQTNGKQFPKHLLNGGKQEGNGASEVWQQVVLRRTRRGVPGEATGELWRQT
jgi:hypothetical protein